MKHQLIFVSIPYSHDDEDVQMDRYLTSMAYVAKLMNEGKFAYSPIASGLELAKKHKLPTIWEFWNDNCEAFLERCDIMHVIMMEGWEASSGVRGEIVLAETLGIPIIYITPDESFLQRYNSHKRMMKSIEDYHNSPAGKKSIDDYMNKLKREEALGESQLRRFHDKFDSRFAEIVEKYIKKYDSDEYVNGCYSKGYEPDTPMFHFFYDYAERYGREATDAEIKKYANMFTGGLFYIHGYFFNMMHGQGTVIKVQKEENDGEGNDRDIQGATSDAAPVQGA